jgi:hypothetical protein
MLTAIIPSRCRREILSLLFTNEGKEFYLRQIAKLTNQPVRSVQLEIQNLFEAGIVLERRKSNRRFFYVNQSFFYHDELRQLVLKTVGMQSEIRKHLGGFKDTVRMAILEGFRNSNNGNHDGEVHVRLIGRFKDLSESGRNRILTFKPQLPYRVILHLEEAGQGFTGMTGDGNPDSAARMVLFQSVPE